MTKTFCRTCLVVGFLTFSTAALADDPGYFLSLRQKGQLIWRGSIDDSDGQTYDVWIVPGYAPPSRYAWESLKEAGESYGEYFGSEKYRDLGHGMNDAFNWALDDVFLDYTLEGIPRAWGDHFSAASRRVEKRVFGWWMAYPWALLASVADNVVRIPVGLIGTSAGIVYGGAIVPSFYLLNSAVVGTWDLAVHTIAVPACGYAWNTVIAPPMALVGQKPAPSRVDGFWVRTVAKQGANTLTAAETKAPSQGDFGHLMEWGAILVGEMGSYWQRMDEIDRQHKQAMMDLQVGKSTKEEAVKKELTAHYKTLTGSPAHQELLGALERDGVSSEYLLKIRRQLVRQYQTERRMSQQDAERLVDFMLVHPPAASSHDLNAGDREQRRQDKKTDPVRFSIEEGKGALKGDHSDKKP